ncbi:transglycosylase SLT domain-containing protein [Curtobacterium sp. MCPF17_011]|uniref:aggregation-promoting factor C-terminal-like domain-containing protein n=1 Tax=Curtobacterium sp. MCPF17_011 TaxID=2175652 RepID=UPI0021AD3C42|nr:transglycosylase SLT domain-containing protein [Curtobacterium sp. MCPF17_011]
MGRHTADNRSDRGTRATDDLAIVSERRAAKNRIRTTETSVARPVTAPQAQQHVAPVIAPVSVAANRVSDASAARAAVAPTLTAPRVVRRARSRAVAPVKPSAPRSFGGFVRQRSTIPVLSFFAVSAFVGGSLFNPMQTDAASAAPVLAPAPISVPQQFSAHGTYGDFDAARDGFDVTKPAPKPVPTPSPTASPDTDATDTDVATTSTSAQKPVASTPVAPVATPDPGSAQAIGQQMVAARGWGNDQYSCLVSLWNKESGWRVNAYNPSGAYGIPQSLPGSKMASAGADWQTNPATQITWGLNYITGVYGTPCGAWAHSVSYNWY